MTTTTPTPGPSDALAALRARRSARRMEGIDTFDAFYQAYITVLIAGVAVLLASGWVGDRRIDASMSDVATTGAAWLGLLTALAVATGLRSGSRGGPVAVEAPDVHHILLAPVHIGVALRAPAVRQVRTMVAAAATVGAVGGLLATHRVSGGAPAWMASGALWAVATVVVSIGAAWTAAGLRLPRWIATAAASVLIGWSTWSLFPGGVPSPTGFVGRLGVLPAHADVSAVVVPVVIVGIAVGGLRSIGGISLEQLRHRSTLVGQMRFAVSMRDLRTVMLLRRQLNQEQARRHPWIRARRPGRTVVIRRDWRALLRTPATRLVRLFGLVLGASAAAIGVWLGTSALVVVAGVCSFLAALEALEPLAQEVDHCTFLDLAPVEKGPQHARHLVVPSLVMVVLGLVAAGVVATVSRGAGGAAVGFVVAVPAALAGTMGAAISILREDNESGMLEQSMMIPPEAIGMQLLYRAALPPAVAIAGFLPVVTARGADDRGLDPVAAATSTAIPVLILVVVVAAWVRYSDDLRAWWRTTSEQALG